MIALNEVTKNYGKGDNITKALNGISLTIEQGEMVAIVGPSGSGKTTLLNIIGCLESATSGKYFLHGLDISNATDVELSRLRNKEFGFIVQNYALINEYTVFQNVCLPIRYSNSLSHGKKSKEEVCKLLSELGIVDKMHMYPDDLSGGQKQRVAIARALINSPNIILADEPTGALDQNTGRKLIDQLKQINWEGKTVIIVTHDFGIAKEADRIIEIVDGKITST